MSLAPLAYEFKSLPVPGGFRNFVVATCSKCKEPTQISWNYTHNPQKIGKKFVSMHWDFDPYRLTGNLCPYCRTGDKPISTDTMAMPDIGTMGKRASWIRQQLHLKREEVAAEAGIPPRLYEHIEADSATILDNISTAAKLAKVFRSHGATTTQNWLLCLPEEGNLLSVNLKHAMAAKSVTAGMMARDTGVALSAINAMLGGLLYVHHQTPKLAKYLGLQTEDLEGQIAPTFETKTVVPDDLHIELPEDAELTDVIAERLRASRMKLGLTQTELAGLIHKRLIQKSGLTLAEKSVANYIVRIEGGQGCPHEVEILEHAAAVMKLDPNFVLASDFEAEEEPEEPKIIVLPAPEVDIEKARARLDELEQEMNTARDIFLREVTAARELFEEHMAQRAAELQYMRGMIEPVLVDVNVLAALQARSDPRLLSSRPDAEHHPGEIDRSAATKQNKFAHRLLQVETLRDREITVPLIRDEMNGALSDLIPRPEQARNKIRHYLEREARAPNGLVVMLGDGKWKLRNDATL